MTASDPYQAQNSLFIQPLIGATPKISSLWRMNLVLYCYVSAQSNGWHVLLNTGNLSKHVLTFEYGNIENASQAENTRAYTYCVDAYAGKHRRKQIQKSEEKSRWRRRQRQRHRQRWQ